MQFFVVKIFENRLLTLNIDHSLSLLIHPHLIYSQVWRVAVFGSSAMSVAMIVFGIIFGSVLNIIPKQSAFVAACLSLSSTPLVVKFLGAGNQKEKKEESSKF